MMVLLFVTMTRADDGDVDHVFVVVVVVVVVVVSGVSGVDNDGVALRDDDKG